MTFYIGVDFHPHQQTLCYVDKQTGAMETLDLEHDLLKVREFYSSLSEPAVIGIEASSRAVAKTATARRLLVKLSIMLRDNITADEFDLRGGTVGNARNCARSEMAVN